MKAFFVLIFAITFAAAPFFSPEFGGFDPDRYPIPQNNPPVQPAGWAFAIWGVIYLGLIMHACLGILRYKDNPLWDHGRLLLSVSLLVGTFWLPVALVSPIWATIMIWVMLVCVLVSLYQTKEATPNIIANLPIALYAGWLSAASFVSIGLMLGGYGFLSEASAAVTSLAAAFIFAIYHQFRLRHWTYGIAVAWGFFGIGVANAEAESVVAILAILAALIVAGLVVHQYQRDRGLFI